MKQTKSNVLSECQLFYCLLSITYRPHVVYLLIVGCFIFPACRKPSLVTSSLGSIAPDFTLQNQYDVKFRLNQFREQNVILLGCDRKGNIQSEEWLTLFRKRYAGDSYILPILNASNLPLLARWYMKGKIKAKLREAGDNTLFASILLDWNGKVTRQYGISSEGCTMVFIDRLGRIRLIHPLGKFDRDVLETVFGLVDQQLKP